MKGNYKQGYLESAVFNNLITSVHRDSGSLELCEDVLVNNGIRDQLENHTINDIYGSTWRNISLQVTFSVMI